MTADRLDSLLSAYLAGRGRPTEASPGELCRDYPDLLPELRWRIASAGTATLHPSRRKASMLLAVGGVPYADEPEPRAGGTRNPPAYWAAFTLSGPGR